MQGSDTNARAAGVMMMKKKSLAQLTRWCLGSHLGSQDG